MMRRLGLVVFGLLLGCAGSSRVDHVVVGYDETSQESIAKLLLLNIARAGHNLPIHFTQIQSVVATYRYSFSGGIVPAATGDIGYLPMPALSGTVENNPTISIAPMQGDEFTQRLLTPFQEQKLTLLLRQGYDVDALFRLLGAEFRIASGEVSGVHQNRPSNKTGYTMYRRLVAQLSSIQDRYNLYVEPLHFHINWTVPEAAMTPEAFATTYKDFTLAFDPAKHVYRVSKRVNGRVLISNYDPAVLSNEERTRLHEEAEQVPFNDVLLDIRAGYVGGEIPMHGVLRLRSFHEILTFLGRAMHEEPEFDVKPDARTPPIADNPIRTLEISESRHALDGISVALGDEHYGVRADAGYQWNKKVFSILYQLFQMSVATVEHSGPSITIAK